MTRPRGSRNGITLKRIIALEEILSPDRPVSVRYCMYTLLSKGLIGSSKDIAAVTSLCRELRVNGTFDDECFVDNRRRVELVGMWAGLDDFYEWSSLVYKLNFWQDQPRHIECWLEKDTTSFLVQGTTDKWRIPLRVSTGYFSSPFLCRAAQDLSQVIKPITIVYIGDFDPSGLDIERAAREGNGLEGSSRREGLFDILSKKYGWDYDLFNEQIDWKRIGVTHEDFLGLPQSARIPIKEDEEDESGERIKRGDPRAAHFKNDYGDFGAEVEAIEVYYPGLLAQRVEDAVNDVIDSGVWVASKKTEDSHLEEIIK